MTIFSPGRTCRQVAALLHCHAELSPQEAMLLQTAVCSPRLNGKSWLAVVVAGV